VLLACIVAVSWLRGRARRLACAALVVALALAALGAMFSGSHAFPYVLANLLGGFALVALWLRLALRTDRFPAPRAASVAARIALAALALQAATGIVLGGMRVLPTCAGDACAGWAWRDLAGALADPHHAGAWLALHRTTGALLLLAMLVLAAALSASARRFAIVLGVLALTTAMVGLAATISAPPLVPIVLHNLTAALLGAALALFALGPPLGEVTR
jgi:cytochrome c oxidase assembly protein subunit 15